MNPIPKVMQNPHGGTAAVYFCGDCITFTLTLSEPVEGHGWIRSNLGAAVTSRQEIIERVENEEIKLDEGWYDIRMRPVDEVSFEIVLPLFETGHFQAKCFFQPADHDSPVWPEGENCIINVEPAGTCCSNIIYNAFVRQFGKSKTRCVKDHSLESMVNQLDEKGYTVIPESGKFRDLKEEVRFIFSELGCRILHLLPVHPTPTTYAKMGRFGSPYAALNFTEVDPALAQFDPAATPLEQFMELADTVHFYNGYIFLDIAINHTGWAASIHESNPEWLVRGANGEIQMPEAWGVVWADLTRLDYSKKELWQYMADMFVLWCRRGVDGFRCDAGYMIPVEAWEYIVAKVRQEYPETLFFLEGLGGPIQTTCDILNRANFNWAYSELFQNYSAGQIAEYLKTVFDMSSKYGHFIHFAETHDNNRLASVSTVYAKMRTSLCALFSVCGGFGFANGVEWFATQKIDVHESSSLNWGAKNNQVSHIHQLNLILKIHPTFFSGTHLEFIRTDSPDTLILLRHNPVYEKRLLILVNLDCDNERDVSWRFSETLDMGPDFYCLITSVHVKVRVVDDTAFLKLTPGEVLALSPDPEDLEILKPAHHSLQKGMPQRVYIQKLKAMMLKIHTCFTGYRDLADFDSDMQTLAFAEDPVEYIRRLNQLTRGNSESRVIIFEWEKDLKRQVMIPPGYFLMIVCQKSFRAQILGRTRKAKTAFGQKEGLLLKSKSVYFTIFRPIEGLRTHERATLNLRVFDKELTRVDSASLLYLANDKFINMDGGFTRKEILTHPSLKLLSTSKTGAMMRAAAWWGRLESRYDAIIAANLNPHLPENRWMLLSRYRIWAVYQDHSVELSLECLERFSFDYHLGGKWLFHIPTSEGKYYAIELYLKFHRAHNHATLTVSRQSSKKAPGLFLSDSKMVSIIIRPDIEDRNFHDTVKAWTGPEESWPKSVTPYPDGFVFMPSPERKLSLKISNGRFVPEKQWQYMVHRSLEASRGLESESDLFSPGYFKAGIRGLESFSLEAAVNMEFESLAASPPVFPKGWSFKEALFNSIDAFLVDREQYRSVIAGYPWFLDWGRDSLIFCRSLIQLKRFEDAKAVLRLFGRFESNGTLPNMICGKDSANRETSDAPLWFVACVRELIEKEKSERFLDEILDGTTVRNILLSMGTSLVKGTPTGVVADPVSLLLYSPSHFTWMDTNFPAGSPRQGYPVEIQALWYYALEFFSHIDRAENQENWRQKAGLVKEAVLTYYYNESRGFFSDCLHCDSPSGAESAVADDALRPNQLFLITLGVVTDPHIMQRCVETCMELLVPGGIRSLSNRKVTYPLPVRLDGTLLNDPYDPYKGRYEGDEDRKRKPAYHNGTAWTWPFPVFCEAWARVFGPKSHITARAWLSSGILLMRQGSAGFIPEILDGDMPHTARGCDAQAWGSSEFARVLHLLTFNESSKEEKK